MNLKEIKEIIDLITEKGISEFELERAGVRLKISRDIHSRAAAASVPLAASAAPAALTTEGAPRPGPVAASPAPAVSEDEEAARLEKLHVVRSPMVGTFYSSPNQGPVPFVQVGDKIRVGQVICIIEAMKLMNEIEAEISGEIVKCYVENGQPVEYGEPLFDVRPAAPSKRRS